MHTVLTMLTCERKRQSERRPHEQFRRGRARDGGPNCDDGRGGGRGNDDAGGDGGNDGRGGGRGGDRGGDDGGSRPSGGDSFVWR